MQSVSALLANERTDSDATNYVQLDMHHSHTSQSTWPHTPRLALLQLQYAHKFRLYANDSQQQNNTNTQYKTAALYNNWIMNAISKYVKRPMITLTGAISEQKLKIKMQLSKKYTGAIDVVPIKVIPDYSLQWQSNQSGWPTVWWHKILKIPGYSTSLSLKISTQNCVVILECYMTDSGW